MPEPDDLFALASANGPALEKRFEDLRSSRAEDDRPSKLADLAALVEDRGRVAINLRLEAAVGYLTQGKLLNVHEWAAAEARSQRCDPSELLREKLGRWYAKRIGFEDRFVDGRRFHYGNLNAGGSGPLRYGNCCAVTSERFLDARARLAFVENDSLIHFTDDRGEVRIEALSSALAAAGRHQHLTAVKHADDCGRVAPESWPRTVCCDDHYVEAIFVSSVPPNRDLEAVRFPRTDYDDVQELVSAVAAGDPIDRDAEVLLGRFEELQDRLEAAGVSLEIDEDA